MATAAQSAQHKKAFLERFQECGNVSTACEESGVGRRTVYDWLKGDSEADKQFQADYADAELIATEMLEQEARARAMTHKVTKVKTEPIRVRGKIKLDAEGNPTMVETERVTTYEGSDTMLIFLLKARAPEKYRERYDVEMSGKGGGAIPISLIDEIVAKADGKVE